MSRLRLSPGQRSPLTLRVLAPPSPALPDGNVAEARLVRAIVRELDVPSVKAAKDEMRLKPESLPPFPAKALEPYTADSGKTPYCEAVIQAQKVLQNQGDKERLQ